MLWVYVAVGGLWLGGALWVPAGAVIGHAIDRDSVLHDLAQVVDRPPCPDASIQGR